MIITVYTQEDLKKEKYLFEDNMYLDFGPERLLREGEWRFVGDTVISDQQFFNYFSVVMDTVVRDKEIDLENHIL